MNEENKISIKFDHIIEDDILREGFILEKYLQKDEQKKLSEFLTDHLEDKDGSPTINTLRIDNLRYNEQTKTGTFRLHFDIERRFCCSDTESCAKDYLDLTFVFKNESILAEGVFFNWLLNN